MALGGLWRRRCCRCFWHNRCSCRRNRTPLHQQLQVTHCQTSRHQRRMRLHLSEHVAAPARPNKWVSNIKLLRLQTQVENVQTMTNVRHVSQQWTPFSNIQHKTHLWLVPPRLLLDIHLNAAMKVDLVQSCGHRQSLQPIGNYLAMPIATNQFPRLAISNGRLQTTKNTWHGPPPSFEPIRFVNWNFSGPTCLLKTCFATDKPTWSASATRRWTSARRAAHVSTIALTSGECQDGGQENCNMQRVRTRNRHNIRINNTNLHASNQNTPKTCKHSKRANHASIWIRSRPRTTR